jgi:hypothetical protein
VDGPPPPPGPAPKPPENWVEMSRTEYEDEDDAPKPTVKSDDWSLVRKANGQSGWVLMRMLSLAIPDEVAQYAEGQRITSYFSLGEVRDEEKGETKHHWLWTTLSKPTQHHQFDGLRVFIYNAKRHRYETAYRERELKGYYPVTTHESEVTEGRKTMKVPGFSVIVEGENRQRVKKSYAFQGYRVTRLGIVPVETPKAAQSPVDAITQMAPPAAPRPEEKGALGKIKEIFKR